MKSLCLLLFVTFSIYLAAQNEIRQTTFTKINSDFSEIEADQDIIVVPFCLIGKLVVVKATAGGVSGNYVVDSGAEDLVINARALQNNTTTRSNYATGIHGEVGTYELTFVKLELLTLRLKNLRAQFIDLSAIEKTMNLEISGFIGYSVLRYFEVIFDYQKQRLIFIRLDRKGNPLPSKHCFRIPSHIIHLHLNRHLPVIVVQAGKHSIRLALDSGAEINVLSSETSDLINESLVLAGHINVVGFGKKIVQCAAHRTKNFKIDNLQLQPMETVVSDIGILNRTLIVPVDGFLGYEFFSQNQISLNYRKKELKVWTEDVVCQVGEGSTCVSK